MLAAIKVLKKRIVRGWLEECHGPYRNSWFIVSKKDGGVRFINLVTRLNGVSIKDTLLLGGYKAFSEEFSSYIILTGIDLFSGYDYCPLYILSKDMIAFFIPLGVLR
jgi:hypothetical protein